MCWRNGEANVPGMCLECLRVGMQRAAHMLAVWREARVE